MHKHLELLESCINTVVRLAKTLEARQMPKRNYSKKKNYDALKNRKKLEKKK